MTDRKLFLLVVGFLGATLLLTVVAIAGLTGADKNTPGILENLAVGCLTGLAGLLARGPATEPQEVVVRQPPGDPVPVDDQAGHAVAHLLVVLLLIIGGALLFLAALTNAVRLDEVTVGNGGGMLGGLALVALGIERAT